MGYTLLVIAGMIVLAVLFLKAYKKTKQQRLGGSSPTRRTTAASGCNAGDHDFRVVREHPDGSAEMVCNRCHKHEVYYND